MPDTPARHHTPEQPHPLGFNDVDPAAVIAILLGRGHTPAAALGAWGDYEAVIAPDLIAQDCAPEDALTFPDATCSLESEPESDRQVAPTFEPTTKNNRRGAANPRNPHNKPNPTPADGVQFGYITYPDPHVNAAGAFSHAILYKDATGWKRSHAIDEHWARDILTAAQKLTHITIPESIRPGLNSPWTGGDRASHTQAIHACHDAIRAGEVYQACISTQFRCAMPSREHAAWWWLHKVSTTRPSKAIFLAGTSRTIASLSPELFLERRGNTVQSSPIKGTIARHEDPALLAVSTKDRAENTMIVDLVRHDFGQVASHVTVTDMLSIVPAPGVWHLVSTVEATVDCSDAQLISACFPPASVTGTPKLRARDYLAEWEPVARGIHCGCVGMNWGNLIANVAIRTAEWIDGELILGTGGGITIDSTVDGEWEEIESKTSTLLARID